MRPLTLVCCSANLTHNSITPCCIMGFVDYTVCSSLESNEPDAFICFLAVQTISIYRQNSRGACVAFNCDHNSDIASLGHGLNLEKKKMENRWGFGSADGETLCLCGPLHSGKYCVWVVRFLIVIAFHYMTWLPQGRIGPNDTYLCYTQRKQMYGWLTKCTQRVFH